MANMGTLFVIAAPSGAGKTTLVNALLAALPDIQVSISHTTRPKRPAEQDGVNYHFVARPEFDGLVAQGVFLEYAPVHGHFYGTSHHWVQQQLQAGIDVILEIDWQGAQQIRKKFPASVNIFILPPSRHLLEVRLQTRNQDNSDVIVQRLAAASGEIAHYNEFDYLIINDVFTEAVEDLLAIIKAQRLRLPRQAAKYARLLAEFSQTR